MADLATLVREMRYPDRFRPTEPEPKGFQEGWNAALDALSARLASYGEGERECICPKCGVRHGGGNSDGGF